MTKNISEYFRYPVSFPGDDVWGMTVTGAGYQPVEPGGAPIPDRQHPPGHAYSWKAGRVLGEHAVVYVTHGRGEFESIPTGRLDLHPGDAAILFPGVWHRYRPQRDIGWGIYWVHFTGSIARNLEQRHLLTPPEAVIRCGLDDMIVEAFRGLLDAVRADAAGASPLGTAKTLEVLARITTVTRGTQTPSRLKQMVRRARLLLEEQPGALPVIDDMIQGFAVSRAHFFRAFRRETGHSPYGYHLHLSIRRAGDMLRNTDLPVKEIGAALGFLNPYHFSKLFKKKTGLSPRHYREQWRRGLGKAGFAGCEQDQAHYGD
jgi:AraC-like DNA-binding protein